MRVLIDDKEARADLDGLVDGRELTVALAEEDPVSLGRELADGLAVNEIESVDRADFVALGDLERDVVFVEVGVA